MAAAAAPGVKHSTATHAREAMASSSSSRVFSSARPILFSPPIACSRERLLRSGMAVPLQVPSAARHARRAIAAAPWRRLHISASSAAPQADPAKAAAASSSGIFLSDVLPRWRKPYFLERPWSATDVGLAAFFVGAHAACLWAPATFTWDAFQAFLAMYVITGMLGITISYHRNLSHKSFVLPKWLEYAFAYCGVLSLQGDPIEWVSTHRHHHQHCDTEVDPHSPYGGFWFSHVVWLLDSSLLSERLDPRTNAGDMIKQPYYRFLQKTYPLHGLLSLCLLYAWGGLPFLIWGGAVRIVWVYHITWLINSCCHVWGFQSWKTGDLSRNNWVIGILAFGEGWHNNHHAFEYSARHGLEWWQVDMTWYLILLLQKLGLATNLKLPTQEHMRRLALEPAQPTPSSPEL